jgi:hypothetical protein
VPWTTPVDLKAQLARLWDRGDLLRPLACNGEVFPLRLKLKGPSSADLTDRFEDVRAWAATLAAMSRVRIECRDVRHRVQGVQRLPAQVWVDSLDCALGLLSKRHEADRLTQIVEMTRNTAPALLPWIARRPLQAVALADQWQSLLAVVHWRKARPNHVVYLRQIAVPGVHSKFIEQHRPVLGELFELALPATSPRNGELGARDFHQRFGFLDKPTRIRFRVLDERIDLLPGATCPDIALDSDSFAALQITVRRVFITENETNFLAFPRCQDSIVIFGGGYGWESLGKAKWLAQQALYYWGDIDTHGFAILDQLRTHFPQASSFLMDRETLHAHQAHWGTEPDPVGQDLSRLTASEKALYDVLRDDRTRKNLRLEQERVSYDWLSAALSRLLKGEQGP